MVKKQLAWLLVAIRCYKPTTYTLWYHQMWLEKTPFHSMIFPAIGLCLLLMGVSIWPSLLLSSLFLHLHGIWILSLNLMNTQFLVNRAILWYPCCKLIIVPRSSADHRFWPSASPRQVLPVVSVGECAVDKLTWGPGEGLIHARTLGSVGQRWAVGKKGGDVEWGYSNPPKIYM